MIHELRHEAICVILILFCFFTCTNTRQGDELFQGIPAFSSPYGEFDSLINRAEFVQDSAARAFDSSVRVINTRVVVVKKEVIREARRENPWPFEPDSFLIDYR